jgi:hypothetical protein
MISSNFFICVEGNDAWLWETSGSVRITGENHGFSGYEFIAGIRIGELKICE